MWVRLCGMFFRVRSLLLLRREIQESPLYALDGDEL